MTLADLKDRPTLITKNIQVSGPGGTKGTRVLTVRSEVISPTKSDVHDETITVIPEAVVTGTAAVGTPVGSSENIKVSSGGTANCYWLPWAEGKVYMGQLGNTYNLFFTPTINGCGFIIGGTEAQPIVAHANMDTPRLRQVVEDALKTKTAGKGAKSGSAEEQIAKDQALIYEQFYGNLAAKMIQDDMISGARLEVVAPQQYLIDAKASFGAVFGINEGGSWRFYGNWGQQTKRIWP